MTLCSTTFTGLHVCRFVFRLFSADQQILPPATTNRRPKPAVDRSRQPMDDVNSERRRCLPFSEVDHGDTGELYAVPEPAQTGLWDACVNRWVNVFNPCAGWITKTRKLICCRARFLHKHTKCSAAQFAEAVLPCIRWLKTYSCKKHLLVVRCASSKPDHKCLVLFNAYSLNVYCRVMFWLAWQLGLWQCRSVCPLHSWPGFPQSMACTARFCQS